MSPAITCFAACLLLIIQYSIGAENDKSSQCADSYVRNQIKNFEFSISS